MQPRALLTLSIVLIVLLIHSSLAQDDAGSAGENRSATEPAPTDAQEPECGSWIVGKDYFGNDVTNLPTPTRSRSQCVDFCLSSPTCNGASFSHIDSFCYLKNIPESAKPVVESITSTLKLCPGQRDAITSGDDVPVFVAGMPTPGTEGGASMSPLSEEEYPGCGVWIWRGNFFGNDIKGESRLAVTHDECRAVCTAVPDCNAVTFVPQDLQCWVKTIPEGALPIEDYFADSLHLCANETGEGAGDNSASPGTIAGVTAGAAAALMALGGLYWLLRMRRTNAVKHDAHALQRAGQSGMVRMHSDPATHDDMGRQQRIAQHGTSKDTACLVAVSPYGGQKLPTGGSFRSARRSAGLPVSGATPEPLGATSDTTSKTTPRGHSERATTRTSTWHVSALPVPSEGAAADVVMNFVHNQLDRVEAALNQDGSAAEILDGLKFTGSGPQDRLQGGQAIVQMAHSRMNRVDYAIKFFVSRSAFEQERELYSGSSPLGQFLPQVRNVVGNEDGEVVDPGGHPLPPCIVMERGESLDLWSDRNAPDRAQAFTVIYHIAQRMAEFHAAGFVHRDLKPGNVMLLPRINRWTVIDFGCAARRKRKAPIAYTLRYAAPEVISAKRGGEAEMVVEEALDAWSLGVMAFEMCVGSTPFPRGMPADAIMDQIQGVGGEGLPWEGESLTAEVQGKLRLFRGALLQLLHRDPRQRPSMAHFCRTCSKMLGDHTE